MIIKYCIVSHLHYSITIMHACRHIQYSQMFFQLQEVNAIQNSVSSLQQSQQSLRKCTKGKTHVVRGELTNVINDVLAQAQKLDKCITEIMQYAEDGYLIPTEIDIQAIVQDVGLTTGEKPQWFPVVFQSEYSKILQSINVSAKKSLQTHSLPSSLLEFQRQVQAFKLLRDRYRSMPGQDILDIVGDAQAVKNRGEVLAGRGKGYCEDISGRIADFVREILNRATKFRQGMGSSLISNPFLNTSTSTVHRQYEYRGYPTRHPSSNKQTSTLSTSPSVTCPNFRCTAFNHGFSRYVPRYINNSRSGMILERDY